MRNEETSEQCTSVSRRVCRISLAGVLVSAVSSLIAPSSTAMIRQKHADASPFVISLTDQIGKAAVPVGLVYTPETLHRLVARHTGATVSARITEAIRRRTPIVVMWSFPRRGENFSWPRPFHVAIVEQGGDVVGPRIDPLWTAQDADELRGLDSATHFSDVGVMAAFPAEAFIPGRWIVLYSSDKEPGQRVQRWGTIEWDGSGNHPRPRR